MKILTKYCIFSVLIFLFVSCTLEDFSPEEWAIEPELSLSNSIIVAGSRSDIYSVDIFTNYEQVKVVTSSPTWCKPELVEDQTSDGVSKKFKVNVTVENNQRVEQRAATIDVIISRGNKTLTKQIAVYQSGGEWDVVDGLGIPVYWSQKLSESQKSIIMEQLHQLIYVEGGNMLIGGVADESSPNYIVSEQEENPLRNVTLSDFYIGKYEVTQDQWCAVMNYMPAHFHGGKLPIENVTFEDAMEYVTKLSELTGLTISLPTCAQWEYAARGGKKSRGYKYYSGGEDMDAVAHFVDSSVDEDSPLFTTLQVGQKLPNELGIYDMSGNVSEICSDYWGPVDTDDTVDPLGPSTPALYNFHVERGGGFDSFSWVSMVWPFYHSSNGIDNSYAGIRIVLKQ